MSPKAIVETVIGWFAISASREASSAGAEMPSLRTSTCLIRAGALRNASYAACRAGYRFVPPAASSVPTDSSSAVLSAADCSGAIQCGSLSNATMPSWSRGESSSMAARAASFARSSFSPPMDPERSTTSTIASVGCSWSFSALQRTGNTASNGVRA